MQASINLVIKKLAKLQQKEFLGFELRLTDAKEALADIALFTPKLAEKKAELAALESTLKEVQRDPERAKEIYPLKKRSTT